MKELKNIPGEVLGHGYPDWPAEMTTYGERQAYQRGVAHARAIQEERRELEAIHRYVGLGAEATAQALHLTASGERFILREYVTYQVFAEVSTLDEIERILKVRQGDQSERTRRMRELATGHLREGEHRGGWVDHAAWARFRDGRRST